MYHRMLLLLYC